jgi:hypothetical protein
MQKRLTLITDTETVGLPPRNFIYDIAWSVVDRFGIATDSQNYLVREILTDGQKMTGAYFAKKIFDFYIEEIERHSIEILPYTEIMSRMKQSAEKIQTFAAYNLAFDLNAIKATKLLLHDRTRVLVSKPDLLCLWRFACGGALNTRLYHDFAHQTGLVSDAGNVRTTAEAAYRFLTGNVDFVEDHTALSDTICETTIFSRLMSRKQKVPLNEPTGVPWREAQDIT